MIEARKIRSHVEAAKSGLPPHLGQRLHMALNSVEKTKGKNNQLAIVTLTNEARRITELYAKRPVYAPKPEVVKQHLEPLISMLEKQSKNA